MGQPLPLPMLRVSVGPLLGLLCASGSVSPAPLTGSYTETPIPRQPLWEARGSPHSEPRGLCPRPCQRLLVSSSRPQSLYICLPALLECPPFQTEPRESWCPAAQLPEELRRVVSVYQTALDLLQKSQVHPEIAAQVLAYLFFFSSTLLFNQLLDKGEGRGAPRSCREHQHPPWRWRAAVVWVLIHGGPGPCWCCGVPQVEAQGGGISQNLSLWGRSSVHVRTGPSGSLCHQQPRSP